MTLNKLLKIQNQMPPLQREYQNLLKEAARAILKPKK